ncbi:LytR/AlgR family response regulator transcription factor [Flavobacterium lotistagni]|uniref:LytR/AlgR family response regulator transcription factor n=1 Tax=Flavobacterium lotistagni TaxID=2709660 RepID=UPI001F237911|nr:response regulator transcription factor [Flavobacterium lotistagni]
MKHSYIIIDDSAESILKTLSVTAKFQNLQFLASANSYHQGLDLILEHHPALVFLEINPDNKESNLSLSLISELYRFLNIIPKIIITTNNPASALEAIQYGAFDYLPKPIDGNALRKTLMKLEKISGQSPPFPINNQISSSSITTSFSENPSDVSLPVFKNIDTEASNSSEEAIPDSLPEAIDDSDVVPSENEETTEDLAIVNSEDTVKSKVSEDIEAADFKEKPLIICVKSYGDYRFIEAKDICYLQADNNSTDIHLYNGEMITAFKTLKHFENVLRSPFVRIHNSYIVNIDYVSRIHTGNSVCYIKNTTTKLPFSKSYKENVDAIINSITKGNYLEI